VEGPQLLAACQTFPVPTTGAEVRNERPKTRAKDVSRIVHVLLLTIVRLTLALTRAGCGV
jgi:hypothetical protein